MATRATIKNRVNKILFENTKGLFNDDCWKPVYNAFNLINQAGYQVTITDSKYSHRPEDGVAVSKSWRFEVMTEGKPLFGVITAHGAGSIGDPLDRYDISAYIC